MRWWSSIAKIGTGIKSKVLQKGPNWERFVDEGEDFRNYTYAKFGKEVIKQPQQFAWQIFDKKVKKLLYKEYQAPNVTKVTAKTLPELVKKLNDSIKPDELWPALSRAYKKGILPIKAANILFDKP